jgi:cytochrome c biogenesis protein CcdA
MQPTKQPTTAEWKVLGCLFVIAPCILGILLIFLGYNAKEEQKELGNRVANFGWYSIFLSVLTLALWQAIRKYIKR